MHYRYKTYPYYRRYYNLNPYYYRRYYNPYYNIIDSQYSHIDQNIINHGNMIDVIQDADVYQSMTLTTNPEETNNKLPPENSTPMPPEDLESIQRPPGHSDPMIPPEDSELVLDPPLSPFF
jgi:hypothetical protein